jgi:hypothetical protein
MTKKWRMGSPRLVLLRFCPAISEQLRFTVGGGSATRRLLHLAMGETTTPFNEPAT